MEVFTRPKLMLLPNVRLSAGKKGFCLRYAVADERVTSNIASGQTAKLGVNRGLSRFLEQIALWLPGATVAMCKFSSRERVAVTLGEA
jgi:hypothetical protein